MSSMRLWLYDHWLRLLAIAMALGALASFPYVYYQVLNWVIVTAAVRTAFQAHVQKLEWVLWLCVALGIVFNPIAPLYLSPLAWKVMDVIAAAFFVLSISIIRPQGVLHAR